MDQLARRTASALQRAMRLIVLFCVLRVAAGIATIALVDRDALAWGPEVTLIVAGGFLVYLVAALALRGAAPAR